MMGQKYKNNIYSHIDNPYSEILNNILSNMNEDQLNFCATIATNYYSNIPHISADKSMSVIAQTILEGNNPQSLIGLDYANMIKEYNNIKTSSISKKINEKDDVIKRINDIINENNFGLSNSVFIQNNNVDLEKMPMQGWKFHISASSLEDYEKLCTVAIPEFNRLGIQFKVTRPERIEEQLVSRQAGKAITVYFSDKFEINNFSDKLKHILFEENSVKVNGDMHVKGRVYGRYGRFRPKNTKESFITDSRGQIYFDSKKYNEYMPNFIKLNSINDIFYFNHNSIEKYLMTNDYKTYLQEKFTMTECDSMNHCYVAFEYDLQDEEYIKNILSASSNDKYSQSFIADTENGKFLMIHKSSLEMLHEFSLCNIDLRRPKWDIKTIDYIIPNLAFDVVQKNLGENYGIDVFYSVDGNAIVKCDTVFNQEFYEAITNELNVPMVLYDERSKLTIQEKLNDIYENENNLYKNKTVLNTDYEH